MHLFTHAIINPNSTVSELIQEGVNLTIGLHKHCAHPTVGYPDVGQFIEPADRDSYRPFAIEDLYSLDVVGEALSAADGSLGFDKGKKFWRPGVFAVKVHNGSGRSEVDTAHLLENHQDVTGGRNESSVFEVGIGRIFCEKGYRLKVQGAAWVVLREVMVVGEAHQLVRSYVNPGQGYVNQLVAQQFLPSDEVCRNFLQLQRNAMWNSCPSDGA